MNNRPVNSEDLRKLVLDYQGSILKLAYAYLKNHHDAEDVAQDVFVAYIKSSPLFKNETARKAWFMQVTANKCKNVLSSAWKKRNVSLTDDLSYLPQESRDVLSFVLSLDERYRIPIHLYYYEGYSIEEIGKILNTSPNTVGTRLARGRKLLKNKLGDDYYED